MAGLVGPENFRKFANIFFRKLQKCTILAYFSNIFKNMREIFARLDEKHNWLGNFEKSLKFFDENLIEKLNFYLFFGKCCW